MAEGGRPTACSFQYNIYSRQGAGVRGADDACHRDIDRKQLAVYQKDEQKGESEHSSKIT